MYFDAFNTLEAHSSEDVAVRLLARLRDVYGVRKVRRRYQMRPLIKTFGLEIRRPCTATVGDGC
jgi:hypothetical protein